MVVELLQLHNDNWVHKHEHWTFQRMLWKKTSKREEGEKINSSDE
jgi:hypothetical protein